MMVPSVRLLFWFALVALPFTALGAVYPNALGISVALIGALLLVIVLDAALSFARLDSVAVTLPSLIRASTDRPTLLPLQVGHPETMLSSIRIGLPLPRDLQSEHEEITVRLAGEIERSEIPWRVIPGRRGTFRLTEVFLETPSRLGFWAIRRRTTVQCEVRVYPNLQVERKQLSALFLHRGTFGLHAQRQVGKGRDFEKLREYVAGDGLDEIHWKATARRGHPVTKVFQIERTQEVYVIIDASRLSGRQIHASPGTAGDPSNALANRSKNTRDDAGSPHLSAASDGLPRAIGNSARETSVLERFITAALILGQAAEQQGDLFGLITFTDQARTFLRARNGTSHYAACRDAIYALEPESVTPDFDEISAFIRTRLRRRALLIFLTSLEDPVLAEGFVRNMGLIAGQHLVLVNMLKPDGAEPLFANADVTGIDDVYRHLGGHLQWHRLRELGKTLQRRGVQFALLENERLSREVVSQYLAVKRRQLL